MKIYSLLVLLPILFAFRNDKPIDFNPYSSDWKKVEQFEKKGLPRSAWDFVKDIHTKAIKEKNTPQIVKTFVYLTKYAQNLDEKGLLSSIQSIESYIESHEGIEKQILQSFLGEWYQKYTIQNLYKLQNQTSLNETDENFTSWSLEKLQAKSNELYLASVNTKNTKYALVKSYESILNQINETSAKYRPSLYELLIDRAIVHFSNHQSFLTEPIYKFELKDKRFFKDWKSFSPKELEVKDQSSKLYQTILLYHNYLIHFDKENNKLALAELELTYLKFIYNNAINDNKKELYITGLQRLEEKYKNIALYSLIRYQLANIYYSANNRNNNTANDTIHSNVKAIEICQDAINKYPESEGAYRCHQLVANIKTKSFHAEIKECYIPNKTNEFEIQYQNIDKLYFRVFKIDQKLIFSNLTNNTHDRRTIADNPSNQLINEWDLNLPDFKDYQSHSALSPFPSLLKGNYIIQVSNSSKFRSKDIIHQNSFIVSNINYDFTSISNSAHVVVRDRTSGSAISNATVEVYRSYYGRNERRNIIKHYKTGLSDNKGFYKFNTKNQDNYVFWIKTDKDEYFLPTQQRVFEHNSKYTNTTAHIFTDRGIYRPGQIVFFKALITQTDNNNAPKIIAGQQVTIQLKDANYQIVKEFKLTTNEYGSIQSKFHLPKTGLTGNFSINIKTPRGNQRKNIKVEEYKRPKFEVNLKDLSKTYTLGDKITIEGNAKAMAGVNLDNAGVQYSVKRTVFYPYYRNMWKRSFYQDNSDVQIAFGTSTTDKEGNFTIEFEALADEHISKKRRPQFTYTISVDVTDINGETHSDEKRINLAYHSVQLSVTAPKQLDLSRPFDISTNTTNLDGISMPVMVDLKIEKLVEPNRIPEKQTWAEIDTILLNKDQYYEAEKMNTWETEKIVFTKSYTNRKDYTIPHSESKLESGIYKITLSHQDKNGELLETSSYTTITDFGNNKFPKTQLLFSHTNQKNYQPGDKLSLNLGSSYKDLHVLYEIIKHEKKTDIEWIKIGKSQKIVLNITEKDRGGFHIRTSFILNNQLYQEDHHILVPWTNKDLKIEYLSFRDHLQPGSKEEWRIKISGEKGNQVAAEFLTTIYDASLDQFVKNEWKQNFYPTYYINSYRNFNGFGSTGLYSITNVHFEKEPISSYSFISKSPYFKYSFDVGGRHRNGMYMRKSQPMMESDMAMGSAPRSMESHVDEVMIKDETTTSFGQENKESRDKEEAISKEKDNKSSTVQIRKNLHETVFFFPQLHTDKEGNIEIRFTMNEALTKWKFMTFAHTKELEYVFDTKELFTRKEIMVFPLAPRFFREGDQIKFTSKVSNLSEKNLNIGVQLELFDALTNKSISILKDNNLSTQHIELKKGSSGNVSWTLDIPYGKYQAIGYRVIAKSGNYGDGEENTVPIVTNRMLVTETMPLPIKGKETKSFVFNSMIDKMSSPTLDNYSYTIEYTANPIWYAIQALPFIENSNHECSEYIFNRFFVNTLASHIANTSPKIKNIFEQWRNYDSDALLSNLQKNQELKSALLEETPWVLDALNEEQQKKNIALLFDLNKMSYEKENSIEKLRSMQNHEGGFSWFPGGRSSRYMTQNIIEGMGHLIHLGVLDKKDPKANSIIVKAIPYLDKMLTKQYHELKKRTANMKDDHLGQMAIHYLYMRSFFTKLPISKGNQEAYDYFYNQAIKYGLNKSVYLDGMVSLALFRTGKTTRAKEITKSLAERALYNEELGMYWNEGNGYHWYELPIERQSLLIETFTEVDQDQNHVDQLKTWLLKNKQTNNWKTTKATTAAIYALLLSNPGQEQSSVYHLDQTVSPQIKIANKDLDLSNVKKEAGTGYFKINLDKSSIDESKANVEVYNPNENITWGAIYWQYFEDLDKIKSFKDTPLKISKKLFKEVTGDKGEKLVSIDKIDKLVPGDKIIVRIVLEVDRTMEFIHLKDMRASGMEPINVMSQYKWQGGLGYYESTKDLATHFYMDYLPKGKYVFEYPLRVSHKGDFSNGITTIQSMYAPEFTSHSVGRRVTID